MKCCYFFLLLTLRALFFGVDCLSSRVFPLKLHEDRVLKHAYSIFSEISKVTILGMHWCTWLAWEEKGIKNRLSGNDGICIIASLKSRGWLILNWIKNIKILPKSFISLLPSPWQVSFISKTRPPWPSTTQKSSSAISTTLRAQQSPRALQALLMYVWIVSKKLGKLIWCKTVNIF